MWHLITLLSLIRIFVPLKARILELEVSLTVWSRYFDMTMLAFFNSREREREDWKDLFHEADERFTDIKIWTPEGSSFSIIEATWTP